VAVELTAGESVIDGDGVVLFPQMGGLVYSNRGTMGNLVVAAPLANRHRSFAGDEVPWRRTEVIGVGMIQSARKRAKMLWRVSGSP
jgi:hypothetical protein